MTDFFLQIGLSNACLSLALAIVAMLVGAKAKRPHLTHMLWLLVFVKLLTPPIVSIPVLTIPVQSETHVAINDHLPPPPPLVGGLEFDVSRPTAAASYRESNVDEQTNASASKRIALAALLHGKEWLPPIWLLGSIIVFAWSMVRVCRFGRLLTAESEVGTKELQTAAAKIARRLKLNKVPTIYTTSTRLSPLVWWAGGKVRIVIPTALLEKMDPRQWQWVLAHELAHVRRRDYLVRWLEWLACVCFWWNPVVWWAQRNLRATEEICCDALVLSSMNPKPQSYANSILTAVESLACPILRPPAVASEINSGGFLERRFKMIVSNNPSRPSSRWLQICVLLCAIVVLPLGIASARDGDRPATDRDIEAKIEAVEARIRAAIEAGDITEEQGRARLLAYAEMLGRKMEAEEGLRARYAAIAEKIKAAIEAGDITAEEGRAKLAALRQRIAQQGGEDGDSGPRTRYAAAAERIKAAIEAGDITEEEGRARLAALRQRMAQQGGEDRDTDARARYAAAVERIKAAIEAGDITAEVGRARLATLRQRMAQQGGEDRDTDARARYAVAVERIKAAIEAGDITEEEGRAKLNALRRRIAAQHSGDRDRDPRAQYAAVEARIRAAVEAGDMTREAAAAWLEGYKAGLGMRDRGDARKDVDWAGIKKRIEGAVESGRMTREEADAKYREIKQGMKPRSRGDKEGGPKAEYAAGVERIRAAIAAGKITEEQGKERLAELRRRLAGSGDDTKDRDTRKRDAGPRDAKAIYNAAAREIRAAVAAGRITEEQGRARLEGLKKRLSQGGTDARTRGDMREGDERPTRPTGDRPTPTTSDRPTRATISERPTRATGDRK